jgi:hypothetical protein
LERVREELARVERERAGLQRERDRRRTGAPNRPCARRSSHARWPAEAIGPHVGGRPNKCSPQSSAPRTSVTWIPSLSSSTYSALRRRLPLLRSKHHVSRSTPVT